MAVVAGAARLGALSVSRQVKRLRTCVIRRRLARRTDLDARDFSCLLELGDGYAVAELEVEPQDWIAGPTRAEMGGAPRGGGSARPRLTVAITVKDGLCEGAPRPS
jgi:hypothetical protein